MDFDGGKLSLIDSKQQDSLFNLAALNIYPRPKFFGSSISKKPRFSIWVFLRVHLVWEKEKYMVGGLSVLDETI